MKAFYKLQEGLYDPNIFKAFFMAGGPGSGKSYVAGKTTAGLGLKVVNSDDIFEKYLKQARLSFEMPDAQAAKRNERRTAAKEVTDKRRDNYVEGRLGMVIDGTGKDYGKITSLASQLKILGYDTHMIFVNTSLDVALERNKKRARQVPEKIVINSWNQVQQNIGSFQRFFGNKNFIVVDNNDAGEDILGKAYKEVRRMLRKKVDNHIAKAWMANQLRLKQR
tara:strand:+ start:528 stop:1193 length:666 start_codon:yes stop_codon:yes gene_type:complete